MKTTIHGVAIDLDGVLYVADAPVEGAAAAIEILRRSGMNLRFVTNTSTLSLDAMHAKLVQMGLPIAVEEIISAPQATLRFLKLRPDSTAALLMSRDVVGDFKGVKIGEIEDADYIVLGDIGDAMSYQLLNRIFRRLMAGSQLIAVHRNRFWQTDHGLRMDIGGFVAGLEYCTGRTAIVMGKPSPDFFAVALGDLGLSANEVAMVGDDIDSDVAGAQAVGMLGILTRTGKFRREYAENSAVRPDLLIDSIRDLPKALGVV